jgi:phosphomevalonate kinase
MHVRPVHVRPVRLTVPGNLLLLGEYAVLEEGGLGLAMAVDARVKLQVSPARSLSIEAVRPGNSISWTADRQGESPVLDCAVEAVSRWLGAPCAAQVHLDSSDLFMKDGRKAGMGSSAAVSVALVCGLLDAAGAGAAARGADACTLALQAHRRAQGGRGSGYDVMTSFHGGCGLFKGGADPRWEPYELPGSPRVLLFAGPAPVATAEAVGLYETWKGRNPGPAGDFLRESNNAVASFVRARTEAQAMLWFTASRELGIELGRSIGVPAELPIPAGLDPKWCKALGAGNELGLCLLPPGAEPPPDGSLRLVPRSDTGVRWEE